MQALSTIVVREPHRGVLKCQCNFQSRRLLQDEETFYVGILMKQWTDSIYRPIPRFLRYHPPLSSPYLLFPERNSRDPRLNWQIVTRDKVDI